MTFPDVDHECAQEIYELIVETVLCLGKYIVISSNRYPSEIVKSRVKMGVNLGKNFFGK